MAHYSVLVGTLPPNTSVTACYYTFSAVLVTRLPQALPPYLNTVLPFGWDIWAIVLGTCVFAELVRYVLITWGLRLSLKTMSIYVFPGL